MERPLVCKSLRKRHDWAGLAPSLLKSSSSCGKWNETRIDAYDIAIPLAAQRVFRVILLSPRDVESAETLSRIERLYNHNGGQDSGIIFLLKADDDEKSAVHALMTLQLKLAGHWDLPVIPVESVATIETTLATLRQQLTTPETKLPIQASSLLPFCSDREPLANHTVNVLTDVTTDFRDLLHKLSSDPVFESELALLLGPDVEKLKRFFADNHPID